MEIKSLLVDEPPSIIADSVMESAITLPIQNEIKRIERWDNWQWQMQNRIRTVSQLNKQFPYLNTSGIYDASVKFPFAITPYYASLIRNADLSDPIFAMSVPQAEELLNPSYLKEDPLEEEKYMPVPGLVHRYPDRALLITTSSCAMYCRHCTRKRVAGKRDTCVNESQLSKMIDYLRIHPEIHDVIISGGDPLTMSTGKLESIIKQVRSVESVDIIRIGTRTPVVLPMRITSVLVNMLKKYHPIYINTHFNHPNELTPQALEACSKLVNAGIVLGNQSVLLKGVNDDATTMETLLRGLLKARVKPYYLFQCDLISGTEHFRTPISKGIEIMEYLRGRLSGLAIPSYIVDLPNGGGKIPVLPSYIVAFKDEYTLFRNPEGDLIRYPCPIH
ncbi:MAG: KamA family radical SAM protein [Synergistaceae bacterium]